MKEYELPNGLHEEGRRLCRRWRLHTWLRPSFLLILGLSLPLAFTFVCSLGRNYGKVYAFCLVCSIATTFTMFYRICNVISDKRLRQQIQRHLELVRKAIGNEDVEIDLTKGEYLLIRNTWSISQDYPIWSEAQYYLFCARARIVHVQRMMNLVILIANLMEIVVGINSVAITANPYLSMCIDFLVSLGCVMIHDYAARRLWDEKKQEFWRWLENSISMDRIDVSGDKLIAWRWSGELVYRKRGQLCFENREFCSAYAVSDLGTRNPEKRYPIGFTGQTIELYTGCRISI